MWTPSKNHIRNRSLDEELAKHISYKAITPNKINKKHIYYKFKPNIIKYLRKEFSGIYFMSIFEIDRRMFYIETRGFREPDNIYPELTNNINTCIPILTHYIKMCETVAGELFISNVYDINPIIYGKSITSYYEPKCCIAKKAKEQHLQVYKDFREKQLEAYADYAVTMRAAKNTLVEWDGDSTKIAAKKLCSYRRAIINSID